MLNTNQIQFIQYSYFSKVVGKIVTPKAVKEEIK